MIDQILMLNSTYYPIVEPFSSIIPAAEVSENKGSLSLLSNSDQCDNVSQYSSTIYEKITKNITEMWLFSELLKLLRCRIDTDSIQGPVADFLNNHDEFKILDNTSNTNAVLNNSNKVEKGEGEEAEGCCCSNTNNNYNRDSNRLTIRQFIKYYTDISSSQFDNKRSPNIALFSKISPIKSNLAKFDNKDIITKNIEEEKISNTVQNQEQSESSSSSSEEPLSLIPCIHCNYQGKSENEVLAHSVNAHSGIPARPDLSLLNSIKQQRQEQKKEDNEMRE
jgi:hypothetical protein